MGSNLLYLVKFIKLKSLSGRLAYPEAFEGVVASAQVPCVSPDLIMSLFSSLIAFYVSVQAILSYRGRRDIAVLILSLGTSWSKCSALHASTHCIGFVRVTTLPP